jgi:hypothetical protein
MILFSYFRHLRFDSVRCHYFLSIADAIIFDAAADYSRHRADAATLSDIFITPLAFDADTPHYAASRFSPLFSMLITLIPPLFSPLSFSIAH